MNTFLISDTHFGHAAMLNFLRDDGSNLRHFSSVEEMDETLVDNWNNTVGKNDKVYHLGDVVINKKYLPVLYRLNGDKVLIKGNHDIEKLSKFANYFRDVRAYHVLDKMILSHIPIHEESLSRWKCNIHGHLHHREVMKDGKPDKRYFNVSVERINYTPIALEEIKKHYE